MPFAIELSPTTASPPTPVIAAVVRAAITAEGGAVGKDGMTIRTLDGARVSFNGDDDPEPKSLRRDDGSRQAATSVAAPTSDCA